MSANIVLIIVITSLATYISRFLGAFTSEIIPCSLFGLVDFSSSFLVYSSLILRGWSQTQPTQQSVLVAAQRQLRKIFFGLDPDYGKIHFRVVVVVEYSFMIFSFLQLSILRN